MGAGGIPLCSLWEDRDVLCGGSCEELEEAMFVIVEKERLCVVERVERDQESLLSV